MFVRILFEISPEDSKLGRRPLVCARCLPSSCLPDATKRYPRCTNYVEMSAGFPWTERHLLSALISE